MNHIATKWLVYVGTYTHGESEGIYRFELNMVTGALSPLGVTKGIANPSFLTLDPQHRFLFSVSETGRFQGKPTGAVSAFAVDQKNGELMFLNRKPSRGTAPCHLSIDKTGRFLMVANYGSGTLAIFPIQEDGRLKKASDVIHHKGSGPNTQRQKGPHAHSITVDPGNRFALAADLGIDKIMIYRLDLKNGKLLPNDPPYAETAPGAGPRHLAFHPSSKFVYVINELNSTMTVFAYDRANGKLTRIQTVSTVPENFSGTNHCADVHVAPSGKFVYGSNRGHDSIVIFNVDHSTGKLSLVGFEPTQGKTPRNFAIDPMGRFLLVANQETNTIVTFRIDAKTGKLQPTGHVTNVPTPVCVKVVGFNR